MYLEQLGVADRETCIAFLRDLQAVRSTGVGHRKGKTYEKAVAKFAVDEVGTRAALRRVLERARSELLELIGDATLSPRWR